MNMPPKTLAKITGRFDVLIAEGESIIASAENVPPVYDRHEFGSRSYKVSDGYKKLNWSRFVEWKTTVSTLLCHILPKENVHRSSAEEMPSLQPGEQQVEWAIAFLRAIRGDLENGFLDSLASHIEADVSADYLEQAVRLVHEGSRGKYEHVPAAVLGGAVLEKALRNLCAHQNPIIPVIGSKGEPKTMNPLIDDLKKAGVFTELKAKQLRSWADIRNKAAHGEFDGFTKADVEQMLSSISNFLADYAA